MNSSKPAVKTFEAGEITQEMKEFYEKNGFLVLDNFLSPETCEEAVKAIKKLVNDYEPDQHSLTVFTTTTQEHSKSQYFRDSADKISFFFEAKAVSDGKLVIPKEIAINKIGHALHEKHQLFSDITFSPHSQEICKYLGLVDPVVPQSMAILKPPRVGGEVTTHQDSTFLYNEPDTLTAFWIPLEDSTRENGCLWAIPGSHTGPLYNRFKRNKDSVGEYMEPLLEPDWKDEDFVPIEMKKGSMIIFPGHLIHRSDANTSEKSRYAYTWHLFDGAKSKWSPENWLQRPEFPKFDKQYMLVN